MTREVVGSPGLLELALHQLEHPPSGDIDERKLIATLAFRLFVLSFEHIHQKEKEKKKKGKGKERMSLSREDADSALNDFLTYAQSPEHRDKKRCRVAFFISRVDFR